MNVEVYQDPDGVFHYQGYAPGVKNARHQPTACGLAVAGLRKAAWFAVGDRRGRVHYDLACATCRAWLVN